jgi:hypothetical protein
LDDAKGVAFLGPEKPSEPAEAHARTLPARSVTVIVVLLYEAFMYILPSCTFLERATGAAAGALPPPVFISADGVVTFFFPMDVI